MKNGTVELSGGAKFSVFYKALSPLGTEFKNGGFFYIYFFLTIKQITLNYFTLNFCVSVDQAIFLSTQPFSNARDYLSPLNCSRKTSFARMEIKI